MKAVVRGMLVGSLVGAPLAGCYNYSTIAPSDAPVGATVRARVSAAAADRISAALGTDSRTVEGELLERSDSALLIGVPSQQAADATGVKIVQRIEVTTPEVQDLQLQRLDRTRTAVTVTVLALVAAYVANAAFGSSSPNSIGPRPGGNAIRIPIR